MIQIIPFKAEHAYEISNNPDEVVARAMIGYEKSNMAFTAVCDEGILCCGGLVIPWQGMGSVWTVNGKLVKKYPITFHKLIRRWLECYQNTYGLNRIQALVDPMNYTNVRWIEALGFKREGIMKKYYNGKDYCLYAKVEGVV